MFIEQSIKAGREDGLAIGNLGFKGRGILSKRSFSHGEFVCEYAGELISYKAAKKREEIYSHDETVGCYMYFFEYKSKSYCIDATQETERLGRLLNHSKLEGNCQTKLFEINGLPHLILVASRDIKCDEELCFDYGERKKTALEHNPWLGL